MWDALDGLVDRFSALGSVVEVLRRQKRLPYCMVDIAKIVTCAALAEAVALLACDFQVRFAALNRLIVLLQ